MSWLTRSIAATLSSPRGNPDPESSSADRAVTEGPSPPRNPDAEDPDQPNTPSRGVKDDISELTETFTRRLWGVASFLAPPPPESGGEEDDRDGDRDGEEAAQSPRIAGFTSDLAEIGGRVRSGITMLQNNMAVAEISKIASSLLPFGLEEADDGEPVAGVTEEVVVFVRHVSTRPETWLDFPLFISERYADDFELSDAQYVHALSMERLVPNLSDLKAQICSTDMSEACFWKIYFVLLHSKLNKQDAELLSTPQILEAREELLQSLHGENPKQGSENTGESSENANVSSAPSEEKVIQPSSIPDSPSKNLNEESSENVNVSSAPVEEKVIQPSSIPDSPSKDLNVEFSPAEEKVIQPSSIQDISAISEVPSCEEPTSDITSEVEAEKFPITSSEVELIDKSVIEKELAVKAEDKNMPSASKTHFGADEDQVDEWPDDDDDDETATGPEVAGTAGNRPSLGHEEDVSFSDLEDDGDDDDNNKGIGK